MIDLDYAMLADYASIEGDKLTVVGASFTRAVVDQVPTQGMIAVAGRIRCDDPDRQEAGVTVRVTSPGDSPLEIEATNRLDISEARHAPYTGNRRGIVFAANMSIPLLATGTYTVEIDLDDTPEVDRVLKFEVLTVDHLQGENA